MRYSLRGLAVAAAAISVAASASPALAASAAPAPPAWQSAKLPVGLLSSLTAGAAANQNDAWAVGSTFGSSPTGAGEPLIVHWNGTSWSQTTTTGIASDASLSAVVAPSGTQVWVSGFAGTIGQAGTAVIYRLSGSTWVNVPLPAGVPGASITSGPDGQVWATGSDGNAIALWTGKAWHVYSTGLSATTTHLTALSFTGSSSGWAVGYTLQPATPVDQPLLPLVLQWNGTGWHKAATPALPEGATAGELGNVLATTSAGVWATGTFESGGALQNWLVHWNGSSWATVTIPAGFATGNSIGNLSAGSSGQPQWISGSTGTDTSGYLYYSGGTWTFVHGVTTPAGSGYLPVLAGVPGSSTTWAFGTWEGTGPSLAPFADIEQSP